MIYLDILGRLGNQMFQYSYARTLSLKFDIPITIQFRVKNNKVVKNSSGWDNSLKYFNTIGYTEKRGWIPLWIKYGYIYQLFMGVCFIVNRFFTFKRSDIKSSLTMQLNWCPILKKCGLFWLYNGYFDFGSLQINKNYFLKGTFEDPKYFNSIRDILLEEFVPKHPLLDSSLNFYNKIIFSNSVCVSIRSFNEIKNSKKNYSLHKVCGPEYFYSAIEIMKQHLNNPVFFIFADDLKWVSENFNFDDSNIVLEPSNLPIWEKLRLMYSCKHFIISSSTFSWWAQYLSRNNSKIVISPKLWFNDNSYKSPLIDDSWIKI